MMPMERSITKLDDLKGQKIQVIAFGVSYVGILVDVNEEKGVVVLDDGKEKVSLDLEQIESFALA